MARVPTVSVTDMDDEQLRLRHHVLHGKRASVHGPTTGACGQHPEDGEEQELRGPFGVWVHSPEVGLRAAELGESLRFGSALPDRTRELAILTVAAFWRSSYEWAAHAPIARQLGVSDDEMAWVLGGGEDVGASAPAAARDDIGCQIVRRLLRGTEVSDELYRLGLEAFGTAGLVQLVTLAGYYSTVAFVLRAFDVVGARAGTKQPADQEDAGPRRVAAGHETAVDTLRCLVANEFASCWVSVVQAGHQSRLQLEDIDQGQVVELDPLQLVALCRLAPGDWDRLLQSECDVGTEGT